MMNDGQVRQRVKRLLLEAGWQDDDILEDQWIYSRGQVIQMDFVLLYNLYPFAVIGVNGSNTSPGPIVDQLLECADATGIPFAFLTDGTVFIEPNRPEGQSKAYARFPSPTKLWSLLGRDWDESDPRLFPPYPDLQGTPTVHHALAVSRTVEAIMEGDKHVLIFWAPHSGRTHIAFQIAWKLIRSGHCQRLLVLCDRQALTSFAEGMFEPFGEDLHRLDDGADKAGSQRVHLSTLDHLVRSEGAPGIREFPAAFYDLILIPDTNPIAPMTPVLEYFEGAAVIGFTGQEPPSSDVIRFYGQPIFTYSIEEILAIRASQQ
jgi:type I restriction enzyme R subunit